MEKPPAFWRCVCAPEDIGKVIGRQGRNIAALRTLLHAVGAKERKHVLLEVLEDRPTTTRP